MVKLVTFIGLISTFGGLLVAGSPVKRQESSSIAATDTAAASTDTAASTAADTAASTAADTAASTAASTEASSAAASPTESASAPGPETTISAFIPSPGTIPNITLYAVTAMNETIIAGVDYRTTTDSTGATTTATIGDVFVVSEDELDLYVFDAQGDVIEATECDVAADGTSAVCNGLVVDLTNGTAVAFQNLTLSGASSGVPVYLPTGTADPTGVSLANAAGGYVSSFEAGGGVSSATPSASTTASGSELSSAVSSATDSTAAAGSSSAAESTAAESTAAESTAAATAAESAAPTSAA